MCETIKIIISITMPFVGIYGGYRIAKISERRKSIQFIRAQVIELMDDAESADDMVRFHTESIKRLRSPIYECLSILGRTKGANIHKTWTAYRGMDLSVMTKYKSQATYQNEIGDPTVTGKVAILEMLYIIENELKDA